MKRSALIAALLIGIAPLRAAQAQDMPGQRILQRIDTNGDGAISKDEMTAARERLFKKLDRSRTATSIPAQPPAPAPMAAPTRPAQNAWGAFPGFA